MVVREAFERAFDHRVLKIKRAVKSGDFRSEPLPDAEMRRLPGDRFAQSDQAFHNAADGFFARPRHRFFVQIDATRKVENPFDGSVYLDFDFDERHDFFKNNFPAKPQKAQSYSKISL